MRPRCSRRIPFIRTVTPLRSRVVMSSLRPCAPVESNPCNWDSRKITTLGLNAFFAETTKFQLNYLIASNDQPVSGYTLQRPRKTRGLVAQFQYGF